MKADSLPLSINGENLFQVPYQKDKRMKAVDDGGPWDRDMSNKWERKMTQYAPSAEKDLTNAKLQKPIKSSSRKTGMVMCSIKVVEDARSLFPVLLENTWSSCPTF